MRTTLLCVLWLISHTAKGFLVNPLPSSSNFNYLSFSKKESNAVDHQKDIIESLELDSKFGRWKFLQDTLEEDVEPQHVNEILYKVLKSFYDNPRPELTEDGKTNPSPILTEEQRILLDEELFPKEDSPGVISILPVEDGEFTEEYTRILDLLEKLHPDPFEEEDAFKSCWDILLEIYGREATKYAQKSGDVQFQFRSSVVRLLLHFDFLTEGIGEYI